LVTIALELEDERVVTQEWSRCGGVCECRGEHNQQNLPMAVAWQLIAGIMRKDTITQSRLSFPGVPHASNTSARLRIDFINDSKATLTDALPKLG